MLTRIDTRSAQPLAAQIAASIRGSIGRGEVGPGDRLPAARELATALDVNVHTVLRAYAVLRDEGLVELRRGRGAVVCGHVDAARTLLIENATTFVTDARRLGLDETEMVRMIHDLAQAQTEPATS